MEPPNGWIAGAISTKLSTECEPFQDYHPPFAIGGAVQNAGGAPTREPTNPQ